MMRKSIVALMALAAVGLAQPTVASARGGGVVAAVVTAAAVVVFTVVAVSRRGGGSTASQAADSARRGFHGGGFHAVDFTTDFTGVYSWRDGLCLLPYYDGYYPYDYYDDGCYIVRRRVMTHYGWRIRRSSSADRVLCRKRPAG